MKLKNILESKALLWVALGLLALTGLWAAMQPGQTDSMTGDEKRIAEVLSAIAGAGKVEVALFYAPAAETFSGLGASQKGTAASIPTGAVVVAQGAGELSVRLNLIRAVRTLLSLPETAVDVFVMEEGR